MFADDEVAERWFEAQRWFAAGRYCPSCASLDRYDTKSRKPMPYRYPNCGEYFPVKKGTVIESSKLRLQKRAIAIYMMVIGIKGTSSTKLHRKLRIRHSTA